MDHDRRRTGFRKGNRGMKLPGWCERCRKVKQVRVSGRTVMQRPIIGICDECDHTRQREAAPTRGDGPRRPDTPH